jgi:hypothetical protein
LGLAQVPAAGQDHPAEVDQEDQVPYAQDQPADSLEKCRCTGTTGSRHPRGPAFAGLAD